MSRKTSTHILGLNAWHPDAAACLVVDGEVVAAAEEERFTRRKHTAGFPAEAVRWCLEEAGIEPGDLDWIAINRDPFAALLPKALHVLRKRPSLAFLRDRLANRREVQDAAGAVAKALGTPQLRARVARVEHHRAHLASSFLVSPFDRAAVVSVDGFGDFASGAWGRGDRSWMSIEDRVGFPHSLGLLYLALTQHLGFGNYGDEYKVMGMAAYGSPRFRDELKEIVQLERDGKYRLALRFFRHHSEGVEMDWNGPVPRIGRATSDALEDLLGPGRRPEEPLEQRHFDLAASLQARYEEVLFHLLRHVAEETGAANLCLAGGCAMNGLANGKILAETPFEQLYVPPAPGDAGGAVGAAIDVWCRRLGQPRRFEMTHAYWGPSVRTEDVHTLLTEERERLSEERCRVTRLPRAEELASSVAERIAEGNVVGWFQDRMEWGPRALGNRSILADPRRADVRELLNRKIKLRETFRPFAPSVLAEHAAEWFDVTREVPFMLEIRDVLAEKRDDVPAVVHADGTGRLQTVRSDLNPRYHALIRAFHERTGVPMVLNTSFNENEPVVCTPAEALDCFLRTNMDVLVLGDHLVERRAA